MLQQSKGRHVSLPRRIILTRGRPAFALTPKCSNLSGDSGEEANNNFNPVGDRPTTFRTRSEHANHNTIEAVDIKLNRSITTYDRNSIVQSS